MSREPHETTERDDVRSPDQPDTDAPSASPTAENPNSDADPNPDAESGPDECAGAQSEDRNERESSKPDSEQAGPRDVVVPMEVYKVVTVFSTLIAVPAVVLGFMFLDAATLQVSFMRGIVTGLLAAVGLSIASDVLSAVLAIIGLLLIAFGAGVYVLGARFRAEGMGNAEEDSNEQSTNG